MQARNPARGTEPWEAKLSDEKPGETPDIYCNSVQLGVSPYDLMIELQRRPPVIGGDAKLMHVGTVRMSLEHAKVLGIMLRKALKNYEDQTGRPIPMHPELLENLGISEAEDW